ncbi:glycosyltransferase family 4 protein [Flavobacterium urumqiense]|uniref:Glycosyltransferase involved in cell wall bisynthesis n=1 Tax=Flavobacterium urumqiense TaxID=935224 RepID=A0A1H5Y441_9FLAO|nr:glycosyltransferase family 4 protein [Flavobacterium urumqiense]SEG18565.1 Glycosyltransferase involved in cell wall bisynthesis [Flavobacterium urumqiense]
MKIVYTAPNRAHHYQYALALDKKNILTAFVSGFPRFSPRAKIIEFKGKLFRADFLQTIYLLSLKLGFSQKISEHLAFLAKKEQDFACRKFINNADIFLFYNGSGLKTCQYANKKGLITIVEVVNCHVEYQEDLLKEEHHKLNIPWFPFHKAEKKRRLKEYQQADYILLPSEFVKRSFLDKGFPEEKLIKVPYGFNSLNLINLEKLQKKDTVFTVLFVGSISVRKGVRYLINAFQKLDIPNKKLLIVGPRDSYSGIDDLQLTVDIIFTGILKGNELENAYISADVFCLPTIEDGFGLVLGEALSYGLPIITTTNSGADDLINDGEEGFIVPIRDANTIYDKLTLLSTDLHLLNKMKLAARKKSSKLNGWDECGQTLCSILNHIYLKHKN